MFLESEEPYQYYGTNSLDPSNAQILKEIDDLNGSEELERILRTLEKEYAQLNEQYNTLLPSVSDSNSKRDSLNIEVRTDEMKRVLSEMEKKGQMISFLKQYRTKVADHIREATSPPRIRGAGKRVKALRLINELRSMSS